MARPTIRQCGRITTAEHDEIERLAERALTAGQIAQRLNRNPSTVYQNLMVRGLRAPGGQHRVYRRANGVQAMSFSAEEDKLIEQLRLAGRSQRQIATACTERFGHRRAPGVISVRLRILAAREPPDEDREDTSYARV